MAQYSRPDWADKVARSPSPGKCSWCQREFGPGERRILQPKSASAHPVYPCESCFDEYLGNLGPSIKADPPWRIPSSTAGATPPRPTTIIRRVGPKLDEPFNPALPAKRGNPHMYGYRDNPLGEDELPIRNDRSVVFAILDAVSRKLGKPTVGEYNERGQREVSEIPDEKWSEIVSAIKRALDKYCAEVGIDPRETPAREFSSAHIDKVAQRLVDDGTAMSFFQASAGIGASDAVLFLAIMSALSSMVGPAPDLREMTDEQAELFTAYLNDARMEALSEDAEDIASRMVGHGFSWDLLRQARHSGRYDNPSMADEDEDLDTFGRMCVLIYDQLAFILGPAPDLSDMDEQASQYFVEEVQKFMEEGAAPTQETARQIAGDMIAHGFAWSQISRRRNPHCDY